MSIIELQDDIGLVGTLSINKVFPDGRVEPHISDENLIMDRAKAHLLILVYDTSGSTRTDPITSFRIGTGGVFSLANPISPKPSNPRAVDLYTPILSGSGAPLYDPTNLTHNRNTLDPALLSSSFPTDVTFTFNLTPNDSIGIDINEVGLFTKSGYMFNHKTFPTIRKTDQFSLQFVWTIKYN